MKLVTFDDGKVGRVDGERDRRASTCRRCASTSSAAAPTTTGERVPLADATAARADRAEEVLPHRRQLPRARGGVEARSTGRTRSRPGSSSSRTSTRSSARTSRSIYPEHLTEELDYELELAVVLAQGRQVVLARGGGGLHRRLRDLQRHHRARHPARARCASGVFSLLQGDRHVLPARPVDRDARRDPRPARPGDGAARQRRGAAGVALRAGCRVTIPEILATTRRSATRPATCSRPARSSGVAGFSRRTRASLYLKPGDVIEAEIERIGVLRNPVVSWQEGTATPRRRASARGASAGELGARRREARARARADGRARARRARRPRARQRPLPDELLGHEGLRRVRLPARGRAGADLPRGVRGGRRAHRLDAATSRFVRGYDEPIRARRCARTLDAARRGAARVRAASGSSCRSARRPPTGWSASRRRSRRRGSTRARRARTRRRCSHAARAIKTEQEIERMRLANEICRGGDGARARRAAAGHEGERGGARSGRASSTARARAGRARSSSRSPFSLVWSGAGHQDVHRDRRPAGRRGRADAVRDLGLRRRLLVPTTRRTALPGRAARATTRELEAGCSASTTTRDRPLPAGREPRRARPA